MRCLRPEPSFGAGQSRATNNDAVSLIALIGLDPGR
jgi:hypothetical protein